MFLSMNHSDTKSLNLVDSEESSPPTKKRQQHDEIKQVPKSCRCDEKETVWVFFFQRYAPIIIFTSPVVVVNGGIHGNSPSGLVCSGVGVDDATDVASSLTVVLTAIPPWQWRKQHRGQHQPIKWVWFALMLFIVSIVHSIEIDNVFTLVLLFFSDT